MTLTWWLQLIGLILGFSGTILMIFGGLGGFIRVYHRNNSSDHHRELVTYGGDNNENDWVAELKTPDNPNWRIKCNYAGIVLLSLGFLFQLAALHLDP
jgi:hypothetical protein